MGTLPDFVVCSSSFGLILLQLVRWASTFASISQLWVTGLMPWSIVAMPPLDAWAPAPGYFDRILLRLWLVSMISLYNIAEVGIFDVEFGII